MNFSIEDIDNIEQGECSERDYYKSIQRAINGGMWSLQGSYGRTMMDAIKSGRCMLGKNPARDYWGNYIPSRGQVKRGTAGSRALVVQTMGESWARAMSRA